MSDDPGSAATVPRPPGARPGQPSPWRGWSGGPVTLVDVRRAVARLGPSEPTGQFSDADAGVPAAVLAPVFEEDGRARVVLTRRSSELRSHTGQIAFPGGRLDAGESPLTAALREASEEVGLDPGAVEIIGELSPISTLSRSSAILPFVGVLPARPILTPNPSEVARIFDVSLDELLDAHFEERWDHEVLGQDRPMHFFEVAGETIWGATARMLFELLELITGT